MSAARERRPMMAAAMLNGDRMAAMLAWASTKKIALICSLKTRQY